MKKLPDWSIYLIVSVTTIVIVLLVQGYLTNKFSPLKNYQRGLQDGMENAEYYCNSFDSDYIGSLKYIQTHDPKLYQELMSSGE